MSMVRDSTCLGPASCSPDISDQFLLAQVKLNSQANTILADLDEYEAISVTFLVLDIEYLTRQGFKYCQYICDGRAKEALEQVVNTVRQTFGHLEHVMEAFYITGRYDILESQLGLSVDHNIHKIFKTLNHVANDRKALYCVFAGMAQEQADELVHKRLMGWYCPEMGRPLEETFVRNLNSGNYETLITELFEALLEEDRETLASYLHPFIIRVSRTPSLSSQTSQINESNYYPLPTCYPHGLCIIINIKTFMKPREMNDNIPLSDRHGSDIDKERLEGTFKLFGFHVMHFDNPDYDKIHQFFKNLRVNPRLAVVSCLAVCIMTHGDEQDQLYLHDRSCISITDIRKLCFSQALLNKPRLYFVQACRGEQALRPILLQQDTCTVTHVESDCLISAATVKGYSAVRSQTEGSWYITDLCHAMQEYGHILPIKNVLQKTRHSLKSRMGSMNNTYVTQLSEDKDTLTKDVQLVRADEEYFLDGILDLARLELMEKLLQEAVEEALGELEGSGQFACFSKNFSRVCIS
nr:uncharacterized protein LOC123765010 isoform X1 [Procambarus clarkii]XP_045609301.1 uncharacterized protein LOC123765010 isoform X1 [Procambarus clarkii]